MFISNQILHSWANFKRWVWVNTGMLHCGINFKVYGSLLWDLASRNAQQELDGVRQGCILLTESWDRITRQRGDGWPKHIIHGRLLSAGSRSSSWVGAVWSCVLPSPLCDATSRFWGAFLATGCDQLFQGSACCGQSWRHVPLWPYKSPAPIGRVRDTVQQDVPLGISFCYYAIKRSLCTVHTPRSLKMTTSS